MEGSSAFVMERPALMIDIHGNVRLFSPARY
jgi:hypothetical protein